MSGFDAKIPDELNIETETAEKKQAKAPPVSSTLLAFRLVAASVFCLIVPVLKIPSPQSVVILLCAGLIAGVDFIVDGVRRVLLEEKYFNRNVVITAVFLVSFIIGVGYEGALLMIFTQFGGLLKEYVRGKIRNQISHTTGLHYETARIQMSGDVSEKYLDEIHAGDIVSVRAGEDFPLDCIVMEGSSTIDTSRLTGSRKMISVGVGDVIIAGSHNVAHDLVCEVTTEGKSTAGVILERLDQPQAHTESPAFQYFTPLMMLISFLFAAAMTVMGKTNAYEAIHRALSLFVLSSAAPAFTWIAEIRYAVRASAATHGILFKNDEAMIKTEHTSSVLFSAEGTLTAGKQKVVGIQSDRMDSQTFLKIAAHAMAYSKDASADAIIKAYGGPIHIELIQDFVEIPHCGVKVIVDRIPVILGTQALLSLVGRPLPDDTDNAVLFMLIGNQIAGTITLSDPIRKSAGSIISRLEDEGVQHTEFVISYSTGTAEKIAKKSGISDYKSGCGEDAKRNYVDTFKFASDETVMYICDERWHEKDHSAADLDVVVDCSVTAENAESADILLPGSRPILVCDAMQWSRKSRKSVNTSMGILFGVKGLLMILAALGLTTVWFSVFVETAAVLAVGVFADKTMSN